MLPGRGRRAVASLWAAAIVPYVAVALWAPVARALGLLASVPMPVVVVLGVIAGPFLVALRPGWAARLPESLDGWLDPPNRAWAALWAVGGGGGGGAAWTDGLVPR
jgi:hypothetical protein